ncbi:TetR family transcriptional regulator [Mesorhizobium sp. NBSH29]|uniref:TetR/AcrR family transcriptional regulator n=1 Tax=Mesorhizobium sp. NBSH29 TaxID=2654249 RepID=UPI0018966DC0|nr:TetR/AcrR family transcriptional regulator [Mesorhizobium sp. NBSH29]QPC88170.1 TetR family transcriptional regulator [Mesorhizobium sp. NBSH29]
MREISRPRFDQTQRTHSGKREGILDAAAHVFCMEGFAGANIDLIAAEAGVSRQTVYNHHGDKENLLAAVVNEITSRCNARTFAVLGTFPDHPVDLRADLIAFAMRLNESCLCDRDGKFLRRLIQTEGARHPQLFEHWKQEGPARIWSALAARFARLAFSGHLEISDPDRAARQFLALIHADLQLPMLLGEQLSHDQLKDAAEGAVVMFLQAFGKREVVALPAATQNAV